MKACSKASSKSEYRGSKDITRVHKDFHGAMSFGLKHLHENYGEKDLAEYIRQLASSVYAPLVEHLRLKGLSALEAHWKRIFDLEEAEYRLAYEGKTLVLEIIKCPAIHHMRTHGYSVFDKFCECDRLLNEEICRLAGYDCSVHDNQEKGCCQQRFWREKKQK